MVSSTGEMSKPARRRRRMMRRDDQKSTADWGTWHLRNWA